MGKIYFGLAGIFMVNYGWTLYILYWSRNDIIASKIRSLEREEFFNPNEDSEREIEAWKNWQDMDFRKKLFSGPPKD